MPRAGSSRTGEPHCGSHCHDRTAAPPLPIALPLRHCLVNTPHSVADLLQPSTPAKAIAIREDAAGGIVMVGVKEEIVTTAEETLRRLAEGCVARTTGSTLMNGEHPY